MTVVITLSKRIQNFEDFQHRIKLNIFPIDGSQISNYNKLKKIIVKKLKILTF